MQEESEDTVRSFTYKINGTDKNPYAAMNLKFNPFGQINKAEYDALEMRLNSLGGEPVKSAGDIRERLRGCSEEFIAYVLEFYKPGEMTEFTVEVNLR